MAAKAERLKLVLHAGHKGIALVFPFDPNAKWGKRTRQFVSGTLNGVRFDGEIGFRRRVFYTLLDDELLAASGLEAGESAEVTVSPRDANASDGAKAPSLVWSRLAQPPMRRKR